MNRPIFESYWVKPGRFLAGEYPGHYDENVASRRLSAFLECGVTEFVDLTQPHELVHYEPVLRELSPAYGLNTSYRRFPIQDRGVPTPESMRQILDTIDAALASGANVYVHCWGGVGRTGTTVGCYLVRHGMTGQQALDQIASWWSHMPKRDRHPNSPETHEQMEFIRNWSEFPHPASRKMGEGHG